MFFIENAKEIMFLCFGAGVLGLCIYLIRSLILMNRILQKVDDMTEIVIEYVQKPLAFLLQAHKAVQKAKNWFRKR